MRSRSLFYPLFLIAVCLSSCEFKCSVGESKVNEDKKYKPVEKDGALIYNGIKVKTHGVKLNKAYLVIRGSTGEMIDEGNFVDIRKGAKLLLIIDSGWKEVEHRVYLDASMKAVADNGEKILDKPSMFGENDGITPDDSKILGLSIFFDTWEAKRPVSVDVFFKVWDKRSDAFVEGSYTIHTK